MSYDKILSYCGDVDSSAACLLDMSGSHARQIQAVKKRPPVCLTWKCQQYLAVQLKAYSVEALPIQHDKWSCDIIPWSKKTHLGQAGSGRPGLMAFTDTRHITAQKGPPCQRLSLLAYTSFRMVATSSSMSSSFRGLNGLPASVQVSTGARPLCQD